MLSTTARLRRWATIARRVENQDRKPGPGMLKQAAEELQLDLANSWMIGDMISDVLAGRNAGCRGSLLVESGKALSADDAALASDFTKVADVAAATDVILQGHAG